jgi:hypothetical protein
VVANLKTSTLKKNTKSMNLKTNFINEKEDLKGTKSHEYVNMLLESYDDIFSDFDPSPYPEKTLSDDFIFQSKKISKNKTGKEITLLLFLPFNKRNEEDEIAITKRLTIYFKKIYLQLKADIRKTYLKGLFLSSIGVILMAMASYISFIKPVEYYLHLIFVLFEPAGWFLLWAGLDNLVYNPKDSKKEIIFYAKMIRAKIEFATIKNEKSN